MCSSFESNISGLSIFEKMQKDAAGSFILDNQFVEPRKPRFRPTDIISTIFLSNNNFIISNSLWGIKFDAASKIPLIFNSRIETINSKTYWKNLFTNYRCIVPATGFFEWKTEGKKKIPQRLSLSNDDIFFFAGIYYDKPDGKLVSLITTEPNDFMKNVHNRMPVIFKLSEALDFLKQGFDSAFELCSKNFNNLELKLEISNY